MASSSSWMPPTGRHTVNIGSSLGRAIKNRKLKGSPAPTTKRSNLPEREFYSFKFNFRASSIDKWKPASMETTNGPENTQIKADYPSTLPGEAHKFNGTEQPARDVDCILIYDEDTGQYTLEKLESSVILKFDRKMMVSPQPGSPAPVATSKGKAKQEDYDMDSDILNDVKVKSEIDSADLESIMEQAVAMQREEEEEGEVEPDLPRDLPRRPVSPPKAQPPPPTTKPARPVKPIPKARADPAVKAPPPPPPAVVAPPPKAKAAPAKSKKVKPTVPVPAASVPMTYPDEEVIEFGKPAKRARPSPPRQPPPPPPRAASPISLSLPGGSTPAFAPPPAPVAAKPIVSRHVPTHVPVPAPQMAIPVSPPQMAQSDSDDDEEDWEQVPTVTPVNTQSQLEAELEEDIFGDFADDPDGGEVIDANDFEQMMNEQMERDSDDDFLAAAVSPEPEQPPTRQPISLNRLASGGGGAESDDEDYSSSDDSDED